MTRDRLDDLLRTIRIYHQQVLNTQISSTALFLEFHWQFNDGWESDWQGQLTFSVKEKYEKES